MASKGSFWERQLCKKLSLWWTGGKSDAIFWRTSNSGGRATVRQRIGKDTPGHYGDIGSTCPEGDPLMKVFAIEAKRGYNRVSIADLLDWIKPGVVPEFLDWIHKATRSRDNSGALFWLLITRRDRRAPLVFMSERCVRYLGDYKLDFQKVEPKIYFWSSDCGPIVGMPLDKFLQETNPEQICKIAGVFNGSIKSN